MNTNLPMIDIAKIITNSDKKVVNEVTLCVEDIEKYFDENIEQFADRGIDDFEEEDEEVLCWLGMTDIMEQNAYVWECDWSEAKEDFVSCVSELHGVEENDLVIEEAWLDEEGGVADWASIIDEKWAADGMCLAAIDIESDSYVLFACQVTELEKLQELATEVGFRIDLAKDM